MKTRPRYTLCLALLFLFLPCRTSAQGTREDYQRAEQFLPGNLRHRIYVADVVPHWITKKNRFWYRKAGTKAAEFILVDADQNSSEPAFDLARLAESLAKALKREVSSTDLPFDSIDFSDDGKSVSFQIDGAPWSCTLEKYDCKRGPEPVAGQYEEASPNKEWVAYVKDHDLYLRYVSTGEVIRLTRDGERSYDYATPIPSLRPMVAQGTEDVRERPAVFWSPDSTKLVTYRIDARLDKAWWNELYQGYPVGPDYAEQSNVAIADHLKGHQLIEHGDIDDNVHVVETMRLTDALIKANKNFDQLIVPNMYHGEGGNPYLIRPRWDYFVQYLLGVTPPPGFAIHEEREAPPARAR